jgi:hypothetical protein
MPKRTFKNVPVDILEYAESAVLDFETRGYTVSKEKENLGYPYTPTFLAKRHSTNIIVECFSKILEDRIKSWVAYARSSGQDTRVVICLPPTGKVSGKEEQFLRNSGVGLYTVAKNSTVTEKIPPIDLALNIQLPELESLSQEMRKLLGPSYDQFKASHWREGFEDACQALENKAREYFKKGCQTGRIQLLKKGSAYIPTNKEVGRWPMGELSKRFAKIISQNHADRVIEIALTKINKDRIAVVHYKRHGVTENRLRKNVGQHMWTIIAALKELI